ncbi:diiron oxygenase [Pimelobacter simplex]|uniref:Diiron oxygenase n=1 Tax=Nocardioides simplex TaxID=2045 RepID=A0A7J5E0K1_NOCSI|nr:diiron oxygenase [Pimelobacter simplex]KAB2811801.1 diiron oxygenase [Pimelobacter simplex]
MTLVDVPGAAPVADRLLRSTARQSYDPEVDLDWSAPPVPGLWWMQPERMSLYGTPLWRRLSEEQRITLSAHEIASIASVGIWFEVVLMQLLLRDVYTADPRDPRTQFALTEVGDETRHTVMFGRAIAAMGVPAYGPRPRIKRIGRVGQLALHGPSAYASILIGEEPVDRWQRELMRDERVQPLTRMVARIHVVEEARHVTFARDELTRAVRGLTRAQRAWHQALTAQVAYVTMRSLVHPDVYAAVGLDPAEARRQALGNEHYRETIAWMGEKVMPVLDEAGMVGRSQHKTWRASFLMR